MIKAMVETKWRRRIISSDLLLQPTSRATAANFVHFQTEPTKRKVSQIANDGLDDVVDKTLLSIHYLVQVFEIKNKIYINCTIINF